MSALDDKAFVRDAILKMAGRCAEVVEHDAKSWASITFAGARHRFTVRFKGKQGVSDGELFIALLPVYDEWALPDQLVADAAVTSVALGSKSLTVSVELLVVEACVP